MCLKKMGVENCFKIYLFKINLIPVPAVKAGPWCYTPSEQKVSVSIFQGSEWMQRYQDDVSYNFQPN